MTFLLIGLLAAAPSVAHLVGTAPSQSSGSYGGRLSVVPVDARTTRTTSGSGRVTATLEGGRLRVEGTFEGTHTPVTGAEIRQAPPGRRGGPLLATLDASGGTKGRIQGTVRLSAAQRDALTRGDLYVLVRTGGNPEGEIRGWLLPPGWTGTGGPSEGTGGSR